MDKAEQVLRVVASVVRTRVVPFVVEHEAFVAPAVLCLIALARYRWIVSRAAIVGLAAALFVLIPDGKVLWAFAVVVFAVSLLVPSSASSSCRGGGGGETRDAATDRKHEAYVEMHRRKLVAFYEEHAPEKVKDVDAILAKYRGHESEMWKRLEKKYAEDDNRGDYEPPIEAPQQASPARSDAVQKGRDDFRRAMDERINARLAARKNAARS